MSRTYICLIIYFAVSILAIFLLPTEGTQGSFIWRVILGQYLGWTSIVVSFVWVTIARDMKKKREQKNATC